MNYAGYLFTSDLANQNEFSTRDQGILFKKKKINIHHRDGYFSIFIDIFLSKRRDYSWDKMEKYPSE